MATKNTDDSQPTSNPPGGGSWQWIGGQWVETVPAQTPEQTLSGSPAEPAPQDTNTDPKE